MPETERSTIAILPADIAATEKVIRPHIRRTPVLEACGSDFGTTGTLVYKLELCQHAGSFKARGAFANLLARKIPPVGVVAASGGNHGVAVAYAASKLGIPAKVFVPKVSSPSKIEKIRALGAGLVVTGEFYADALAASECWAAESGALRVHAFDQLHTLLGQGTLGLELEQQVPDLDTLLISVGGGGLLGGIAAWFKDRVKQKTIRIIGVEPAAAPTLTYALRDGCPTEAPAGGIAADSLAPRRIGELVFPIAKECVARVILVPDQAIADAQQMLWTNLRIVAEPGGAAASAALFSGLYKPKPKERVGVIVSGGNTTAVNFARPTST
jgi:threonine dehydratase